ncbi:MAG: DHHA1 domain-containing protein, partial [Solirubrobacteraceae bacterium]
ARQGARGEQGRGELRERAAALSNGAEFETQFVGYETTEAETTIGAAAQQNGELLVKLLESPFYATGGGQVADGGIVECESGGCRARVTDVIRLGSDQVVKLAPEHGAFAPGERVRALVDRAARHATACNHTATHLLHASLRRRLGSHVHQAGSYVGPDKLRFDFTHGGGLTAQQLREVQDDVNGWILQSHPVRAITTTLDEAKTLGAMALFNEKYGEIVRMVEVGDGSFSRELCGGTHVHGTAEIGLFRIMAETSSAANVRRIEAITGPEAVRLARERDRELELAAERLRVPPARVAESVQRLTERVRELERTARDAGARDGALDIDRLATQATETDGARILTVAVQVADGQALLDLIDRLKGKLADAAIVLGSAGDGRVDLVVSVAPALVARGIRAGDVVKAAAAQVGGGGGGRDTLARAGGRDPDRLPAALQVARETIEAALRQ